MGTGSCAAISVVTECVNVHATLGIGIMTFDVPLDGGGSGFAFLLESHGAGDLGVAPDDGNCTWR